MKTAKKIIGIISIVLFVFIAFQSCAAGVANTLEDNRSASGSAGILLAFCMLIAGIVGVAGRKSKGASITAGIFYAIGGLVGISNVGNFADLMIWSVLSFIFAAVFILGSVLPKKIEETKE